MDFALTEEQQALGDLAARILGDRCTNERLQQLEAEAPFAVFDRALWGQLAAAGITGAAVPEEHGGSGLGPLALLRVLEVAGEHVAPVPLVACLVASRAVAEHGTGAQRSGLLPGVVAGEVLLSLALEEAGNDDLLLPTVEARADGDDLRLDGEKSNVPYAQHADRLVVSVAASPGVALALVDPAGPGVEVTEERATNRQPTCTVRFRDVHAELLAAGHRPVQRTVQEAVAATCVVQAGVCEGALRMTARHTAEREQFGKPIAEFQAVAQRAADAFIDTEMVRLTAWQALFAAATGRADATEAVHTAKYWAGAGAMRVVHAAQHLHGGLGVDLDYPLHRYFVWAKQLEHTLGTPTRELRRLGTVLAVEPA